jgi:hypothetical protein
MHPVIPAILQRAFVATLTRDAYRDRTGRYRLRSRGGRPASWDPIVRSVFPNPSDLTRAAARWLELWDAVPLARLAPSMRTRLNRSPRRARKG